MRSLIQQSYPLACLYYLASNFAASLRFRTGLIDTGSGASHLQLAVDQSVRYVEEVFSEYKQYAQIDRFSGRVAEVGPGDNCGVGLLLLQDGCTSVDLADRFYAKRNARAQASIYAALWRQNPGLTPFLQAADLEDETTFKGLTRWYGASAAAEEFFVAHTGYDFIVSRAVLEHLFDPLLALGRMAAALNPGGMLIHKIDLRDHGMFSGHFHELKFLEPGDWLHRQMTRATGRPNRVLLHQYRHLLEKTGLTFDFLVTRLAGVGDIVPHRSYAEIPPGLKEQSLSYVRSIRHRFAPSFRQVDDEDLCVAGVLVIARKN